MKTWINIKWIKDIKYYKIDLWELFKLMWIKLWNEYDKNQL